jgi:hypothetical protein
VRFIVFLASAGLYGSDIQQGDKVKKVGSHIKLRECTPNLVQKIRAKIVAGNFEDMSCVEYDQQVSFV